MRDSFIIFTSYIKNISRLNMEQMGALLTAMMCYQLDEDLPEMDDITDLAFSFIKDDMDHNNEKYDEMCERNRENGKKGGRPSSKPSGFSEKPKKPSGFFEGNEKTQQNPTKPKETLYEYEDEYEYENDNDVKEEKSKQKKFVKPTLEEIRAYCQERNNGVDSERFFDFYESKGWKVGNQGMKDWKAAVRTWEQRDKKEGRKDDNKEGGRSSPESMNMSKEIYDKIHSFPERNIDYATLQKEVLGNV